MDQSRLTFDGRGEWGVRPYAPGDEGQLAILFEQCFGRPLSPAHFRWKVGDPRALLPVPSAWVADTGEILVGHYAGTPMRFKLGAAMLTILHACDVMTHPDFRKQGILTAVGGAATEAWQAAGVPFLTGLHYGGWGSRRHYLGWREQFKGIWLWRPLRFWPLLQRRNTHGAIAVPLSALGRLASTLLQGALGLVARGIQVVPVARPGDEFDELWERVRDRYEALVVRDREWIAYRYVEAPDWSYHILLARRRDGPAGYLVYRMKEEQQRLTGWIVDLLTDPDDFRARAALLRAALHGMFRRGAESARIFVPARTRIERQLRRAGFLPAAGSYDISIVSLRPDMPHPALRDPARWYTLAGDFDIL